MLNLETSVESPKSAQLLGTSSKSLKFRTTNKVALHFQLSLSAPMTYTAFWRSTEVSRLNLFIKPLSVLLMFAAGAAVAAEAACPDFLNQTLHKLHSKEQVNLCTYYRSGAPLLIVNTASHCGYTKQFKGLEALYQSYKGQGLVILGFPSNTFKQEEDNEMGTANVCYQNYGVTFPMFEKIDVRGSGTHPLFAYLASKTHAPSWNFNKYLLLGAAPEIKHFGSNEDPQGGDLEAAIKKALLAPSASAVK
jgi:glutathione peroxidase